jgi:hypothetical protein
VSREAGLSEHLVRMAANDSGQGSFGWSWRGEGCDVERTVNSWPKNRQAAEGRHGGTIGAIITGIIIGFLGKFVAPGSRANTPMWLTFFAASAAFDWLVYLQRFWRQWLSWNRLGALAHCNCGATVLSSSLLP